jgi:hypothetical protein
MRSNQTRHHRHQESGELHAPIADPSSTETTLVLRRTLEKGLLTCLLCLGTAIGVMAASNGSAHAAAPAPAKGNWSEFGFVPKGDIIRMSIFRRGLAGGQQGYGLH